MGKYCPGRNILTTLIFWNFTKLANEQNSINSCMGHLAIDGLALEGQLLKNSLLFERIPVKRKLYF